MIKQIPLTKGAFALVDDADYDRLVAIGRWSLSSKGYAVHWFRDASGKRKCLYMHRVIVHAPPHLQVDHINHKRLDNRRDNLRFATRSQNNAARRTLKSNTSGYTGVNRNRAKWEARIKYQNRRIFLGSYASPEDAALAYDYAARLLFEAFARPNFPELVAPPEIQVYVKHRLEERGIDL